jgi:hypothetical protein
MLPRAAVPAALIALAVPSLAQVTNPADDAASRSHEELALGQDVTTTTVVGRQVSEYREEDRIGTYDQPRWTARRLFPSTRVYVRPEGSVGFEYWTRVKVPRDEGQTTVETQYEVEFGLPHRFQIDLYAVTEKTGSEGELNYSEQKAEVRYALADWGQIWMNPTLYFEYVARDLEADVLEYKLLLGDELAPGWHFGSNLVFEHETGGELENEYELTMGLSRVIIDEKLSLGAEMKAAATDVHEDRGDYEKSLEIGPSMRWCPTDRLHVDLAPLVGIGGESRAADIFLVIGLDL